MLSNNDKSKKKRNNNINKTELWNIFNNEVENENKPVIPLESNQPESMLVIPSKRDLVMPFSSLPPEICEKILVNLEPVDLLRVSGVSKIFKHLWHFFIIFGQI